EESGPAQVNANSSNAGQYQLQNNLVDPNGDFGQSGNPDLQSVLAALDGLGNTQLDTFQTVDSTTGGFQPVSLVAKLPDHGKLKFTMSWQSNTPDTQVFFSVT